MHSYDFSRHLECLSTIGPLEPRLPAAEFALDTIQDYCFSNPPDARKEPGNTAEYSLRTFLADNLKLLDRPGGRSLLALLGNLHAKYHLKDCSDCKIRHDGDLWLYSGSAGILVQDKFTWHLHVDKELERYNEYYFSQVPIENGQTIVHIGAGTGADIILASRLVGKSGKVIAIEAHPRTYMCLERCCKENELANVTAINVAICDRIGEVGIENSKSHVANSIITGKKDILVACTTLDQQLSDLKIHSVDYLIMNIEGAEQLAILGMSQTIDKVRRALICCHDFRADLGNGEEFRTKDLVLKYLKANGFFTRHMSQHPHPAIRDHIYAERLW